MNSYGGKKGSKSPASLMCDGGIFCKMMFVPLQVRISNLRKHLNVVSSLIWAWDLFFVRHVHLHRYTAFRIDSLLILVFVELISILVFLLCSSQPSTYPGARLRQGPHLYLTWALSPWRLSLQFRRSCLRCFTFLKANNLIWWWSSSSTARKSCVATRRVSRW